MSYDKQTDRLFWIHKTLWKGSGGPYLDDASLTVYPFTSNCSEIVQPDVLYFLITTEGSLRRGFSLVLFILAENDRGLFLKD